MLILVLLYGTLCERFKSRNVAQRGAAEKKLSGRDSRTLPVSRFACMAAPLQLPKNAADVLFSIEH